LVGQDLVPLSGAVIVNGSLVVHSEVKKVQHPSGGVVAAIAVRNGSKVEAGQELVRLDETSARTNLQVIARQLDEIRLRIARLIAERDGAEPHWPTSVAAELGKYPPAEPGALALEPLEAADGGANAAPKFWAT
jgi:HlyD family secretion protein